MKLNNEKPLALTNVNQQIDENGIDEEEVPVKKSNAGFMRVMSYYNPKELAVASCFISIVGAFAFPMFGYIFSELMFVIIKGTDSPTYLEDRKTWILNFLYLALGMGFIGFL